MFVTTVLKPYPIDSGGEVKNERHSELRHGSKELVSSSSPERSSSVRLRAAKPLSAERDRPFAAPSLRSGLRLTQGDTG